MQILTADCACLRCSSVEDVSKFRKEFGTISEVAVLRTWLCGLQLMNTQHDAVSNYNGSVADIAKGKWSRLIIFSFSSGASSYVENLLSADQRNTFIDGGDEIFKTLCYD